MKLMSASDIYSAVEHIKTIVKQLTGDKADNFSNKAAGTLTNSTLEARKNIYDEAAGKESHLSIRNTKQKGWTYVRTLTSGEELQLLKSTGKDTYHSSKIRFRDHVHPACVHYCCVYCQ